ncbi:hypothetical protein AMBLS11_12440 [Alteromonas macleodii str. 'Black Sea 11']|nr:hypothetical protein AMBLS11_12440 [Alteromonas macleodii str. 'Black Sea 11']
MRNKLHYGLESIDHARELAHLTCQVLGYGQNQAAPALLLETACAETQLGQYPDNYAPEGHGLHQFDTIAIVDVQQRTRRKDRFAIQNALGVDILQVTPASISKSPLESFIFCRLKYKLRPEIIPDDIVSRAVYWKRFYNTHAGKGTIDHYLDSAERILYPHLSNQEEQEVPHKCRLY